MAQKNATHTKDQQVSIAKAGLNPHYWTVIRETMYSMIICHRETKEVKLIGK